MPNNRGRAFLERVHQSDDVARQVKYAICVNRLGTVGLAVAALVRRDDAETRLRERRYLMAPGIPEFRKSMAQNDQRPLAQLDIMHPDAVGLDEMMGRLAHRCA